MRNRLLPSELSLFVKPSNFFNSVSIGICGIPAFSALCNGPYGISRVKKLSFLINSY